MVVGLTELRELGAGSQGRVVLARRDDTGELVAVKHLATDLLRDEHALTVFRGEAAMLARVSDPHVARLLGYIEAGEGAAIVMEAVNGAPLRAVLDAQGALSPTAALTVLKGSLLGLAAAHAVGVVHRDYKPANVVVQENGQSKLIDFGIAVLTGQGGRSGTPAYMAPEQWQGQPASPATDLYAATCVFYECLTGGRPFPEADTVTLKERHTQAPVPADDVPEPLRPLVLRGMAKDPGHRLWDVNEFVTELETTAATTYGADWERQGRIALGAAAAALAASFPFAAMASTAAAKGLLAKLGGAKVVTGVAAGATAVAVAATLLLWPSSAPYRPAWIAEGFQPASNIERIDGGFALYGLNKDGTFEVMALDARTGKVRWRHPASPSQVLTGVGMQLTVKDGLAIFQRPVGAYRRGWVEVVAVDTATGSPRWSYGSQGLYVWSQPIPCNESGRRMCLLHYPGPGRPDAELVVLDTATGAPAARVRPLDGRHLGDELFVSGNDKDLVRVSADGKEIWRHPMPEVFDAQVDPTFGWHFLRAGGRYIGAIGLRRRGSEKGGVRTVDLSASTLAGFDMATGRRIWNQHGADTDCGAIEFTLAHPVRCRVKGRLTQGGARPIMRNLDVTVEGFDPATGATRWSWRAGPMEDLVYYDPAAQKTIIRVSETRYLIRGPSGPTLLDVDSGARPIRGKPPKGWCTGSEYLLGQPLEDNFSNGTYHSPRLWPCDADGRQMELPVSVPDFAGVRAGDTFAWTGPNGVQAVFIDDGR